MAVAFAFPPSEMLKGAMRSSVGTQGWVIETAQTVAQHPTLPGTHPAWSCSSVSTLTLDRN